VYSSANFLTGLPGGSNFGADDYWESDLIFGSDIRSGSGGVSICYVLTNSNSSKSVRFDLHIACVVSTRNLLSIR
jgi:hypothetical protein